MPALSPAQVAAPSPRQVLLETPFWALLVICALVPGSAVPWLDWNGLPLRSVELMIALVAGLYLAASLIRRLYGNSAPAWRPVLPLLAAGAYAASSLLWSDLDALHTQAMSATVVFALSAALLAAALVDLLPLPAVAPFLWRLTIFLSLVCALYAAESIFALGLRSEANRSMASGFGIDRVRGPLFGSATGYVAILPALGYAVERSLACRSVAPRLVTAAFLLAILGMGSRAGLFVSGLFLVVFAFTRRGLRRKASTLLVLAVVGAAAAAFVFSRASAERLWVFADPGRELTHRMAAAYFRSEPLSVLAAGAGYGAIWPWYLRDALRGEQVAAGDNLASTAFGPALYHSHSTLLTLVVELGAPGVAAFLWLLAMLVRFLLRARQTGRWFGLASAVGAASLGFFFDLFLFKNTTVNLVWWIYAAALARLTYEEV